MKASCFPLTMSKVHPKQFLYPPSSTIPSPPLENFTSTTQETFTVWMRSLLFNCKGCTAFDSNGRIVYRIDNYGHGVCKEVCVMDLCGKMLFTISRKRMCFSEHWEGYRCGEENKTWFNITKSLFCRGSYVCSVTVTDGCQSIYHYKIKGSSRSQLREIKILDQSNQLVAEVKKKRSSSGVLLGDDVLSLVVEPTVDRSLIIGIIAVNSLMSHNHNV